MERLFTVVIPLYNKASHISKTIASILAQEILPAEIIVVDDGSTDDSVSIVEGLGSLRVPVRVIRQENGGVSRARNRGLREVTSEWVTFLDADDVLHPSFLTILTSLALDYGIVNMVATNYVNVKFEDKDKLNEWLITETYPIETVTHLPDRWIKKSCFFTSSVGVRTAFLTSMEIWFPEGESHGEDLDLWFRIAEKTPIILSSAPLVGRVWVPGGLSTQSSVKTDPPYLDRMAMRAKDMSNGLTEPQRSSLTRYLRHYLISVARIEISNGNRGAAIRLLNRARIYGLHKRWWVTAVMVCTSPGFLVQRWQHWRKRRGMNVR